MPTEIILLINSRKYSSSLLIYNIIYVSSIVFVVGAWGGEKYVKESTREIKTFA